MMTNPFHEGEIRMQELTGERDAALLNGRIIRDRIPAGARSFLLAQRLAALGFTSPAGEVWASVVTGPPGFVAPSPGLDAVDLELADETGALAAAPLSEGLAEGQELGVLFIDLATRRRFRVNGVVASRAGRRVRVTVGEAYANCPKYIQERAVVEGARVEPARGVTEGAALTGEAVSFIERADTFFVASRSPSGRMDASHRGGPPGFVRVQDGALRVPDYPGNSMFNTLGNLLVDPRAGLVFPDFEAGRALSLTGEAVIDLRGEADVASTGGSGRSWVFRPTRWIMSPLNVPLSWRFVRPSPYNP
jgi:hypothetical protein